LPHLRDIPIERYFELRFVPFHFQYLPFYLQAITLMASIFQLNTMVLPIIDTQAQDVPSKVARFLKT